MKNSPLTIAHLHERAMKRGIPLAAKMDITYRCNFRCVHCFNCPSDEKELSFKEIVSVLDQLAEAGTLFLTFSGGEPLLRNDFFDIAFYARKLGFALRLFTNASLIGEETADKIALLYPESVYISLYGASESAYEKVTGDPMNFRRALSGIDLLNQRKITMFLSSYAFNFFSLEDLSALKKLSKRWKATWDITPRITVAVDSGTGPLQYRSSGAQLRAIAERFPDIRSSPDLRNRTDRRVCETLRFNIYVSPYGNVGHCYRLTGKESIREKPLMRIWKNDPLLKKQRDLTFRDLKKCLDCSNLSYCYPCPAANYKGTGKLSEPLPAICEFTHLKRECSENPA